MGRLLITNVPAWDSELREAYAAGGFRESAHFEEAGCRVTSYKKLKIDNCNTYEKGGDFVATAGTLIYKELFDREAMEQLLSDAKSMSVTELRRNMIGSFVVAVKTGKTVRVFVDETHTYSVHYYSDGNRYLLTNTFYHVEKCARQKVHEDAFLERCIRGGATMSRQSPFQNIFKLCARDVLHIDLENDTFRVEQCELNDYSCTFSSREEAAQCLFERLEKLGQVRSKYLRAPLLFLTGGMDSRVEFAINLYNHDKVRVAYWSGDTVITNGTNEDINIVKVMAEKRGIPFTLYDVSETLEDSLAQITAEKCNRYGDYACIYASNSKWFKIFEDLEGVDSFEYGYFGEVLRPLSELEKSYRKPYPMDNLIQEVYCRSNLEKEYLKSETLYPFIKEEMMDAMDHKVDALSMSIGSAFQCFTYSRFDADCVHSNFVNMFVYSFPIISHKTVMDAVFSIPYEWCEGQYYSIVLTKMFKPDLLELPYFSHHHLVEYDPASDTAHDAPSFVFKSKVKQMFFKGILGDIYLRYVQRIFRPRTKYNDVIFERCKQIVRQSKTIAKTNLTPVDVKNWRNINIDDMATVAARIAVMDTLDIDG